MDGVGNSRKVHLHWPALAGLGARICGNGLQQQTHPFGLTPKGARTGRDEHFRTMREIVCIVELGHPAVNWSL